MRLWTDEQAALLGTDTDAAVGKLIGKSPDAVNQRRRLLNIPCCPNKTQVCSTCSAEFRGHHCRRYCDDCLQKQKSAIKRRNKQGLTKAPPFGALIVLKRLTKSKWLCRCKCGRTTEVFAYDLMYGKSKTCGRSGCRTRSPGILKSWTPAQIALLGTATDAALAKRFGKTHPAVEKKRRTLGIPPFSRNGIKRICPRCGAEFSGHAIKKHCSECAAIREREGNRRHHLRRRIDFTMRQLKGK